MSLPSDDSLMGRIAAGDHAACRLLMDRHLGPILAFCQRVLGNRTDAEDIAQEVFVRAWAKAPNWEPGAARLTTWLHTVALNLCRDRLRRRVPEALDDLPERSDPAPDAEEQAQGREIGRHIEQVVAELPDRQRVAIVLTHYQGMDNPTVANVLNLSVEAVESLLARARRTLRRRLQPLADDVLRRSE